MYGGGLLILLVSEFVVFQPNNYDNNKLTVRLAPSGLHPGGKPPGGSCPPGGQKNVRVCLAALCIAAATPGQRAHVGARGGERLRTVQRRWHRRRPVCKRANGPPCAVSYRHPTHKRHSQPSGAAFCGSPNYVSTMAAITPPNKRPCGTVRNPSAEALAPAGRGYVAVSGWGAGRFSVDEAWYARRICELVFRHEVTPFTAHPAELFSTHRKERPLSKRAFL